MCLKKRLALKCIRVFFIHLGQFKMLIIMAITDKAFVLIAPNISKLTYSRLIYYLIKFFIIYLLHVTVVLEGLWPLFNEDYFSNWICLNLFPTRGGVEGLKRNRVGTELNFAQRSIFRIVSLTNLKIFTNPGNRLKSLPEDLWSRLLRSEKF